MEAVLAIDHALGLEPYAEIEDMPREVGLGIWDAMLTTPPEELTARAEAWLTALVPSAQVEVWDGSGHMLHLVDPKRFAARVRPLLSA
jgi:pimeloyl-ACP methyl ester carboxylesterase